MGIFSWKRAPGVDVAGVRLDQAWVDAELDAAWAAVRRGDLTPGLGLLRVTPANTNLRSIRATGLAKAAVGRSEQLELRLESYPSDPDLLLWLGQTLVFEAWSVRTAAPAAEVSEQRILTFHSILRTAADVLQRAIVANADDAVPWEVLQWAALGLGASLPDKAEIFHAALVRNPTSYAAHTGRVQVLAPKWSGLELTDLVEFGQAVLGRARPGSVLCTIAAHAFNELWLEVASDQESPRVQRMRRYVQEVTGRRAELLAVRDKWWVADRTPDPADISAHGALAFALKWATAKDEALEHAVLTTGRIESVPWGYVGGVTGFAETVSRHMS
ncbi:hypothetical protein HPO96_26695 [Kribbella sandramycini]|uniref:Uncharacterized protein n=1 Tax=Kribbella sandramycini TaxID=60450 RepID=A0A7Y4L5J2_9ACTN|nr:hypothetical protein [Kribbella sandramycini]MBB6570698.1 hypothetical protein [Kribbella sandramycini]NOL43842.1 hypothetical protein [Kribbella sandramycini]